MSDEGISLATFQTPCEAARLGDTKAARLVRIGVLTNGQNVVLAVESGQRESKELWGNSIGIIDND